MNITFTKWVEAQKPEVFAQLYTEYKAYLLGIKRQRNRLYQKKMHKLAKQAIRANAGQE